MLYTHHAVFSAQTICIEFEGQSVEVPENISVAAAVLGHTHASHCRQSIINGENRAPFCLIGVCHECLMEIDGKPYQQACMIIVKEGMTVKRQRIAGGQ